MLFSTITNCISTPLPSCPDTSEWSRTTLHLDSICPRDGNGDRTRHGHTGCFTGCAARQHRGCLEAVPIGMQDVIHETGCLQQLERISNIPRRLKPPSRQPTATVQQEPVGADTPSQDTLRKNRTELIVARG